MNVGDLSGVGRASKRFDVLRTGDSRLVCALQPVNVAGSIVCRAHTTFTGNLVLTRRKFGRILVSIVDEIWRFLTGTMSGYILYG